MKRAFFTGTIYVLAVFAGGFVLGVLRTLVLIPLLGEVAAVMVELPVILTIAWLVCRRILQRWPLSPLAAVGMGAVAFALLMVAEAGLSTVMAGRSLAEHLSLYSQLPHQIGLAGQLAFALFPWVQARGSKEANGAA
ncbi:MAG: hypothetical protein V4669_08430 [Pseudomonadota bacterium]